MCVPQSFTDELLLKGLSGRSAKIYIFKKRGGGAENKETCEWEKTTELKERPHKSVTKRVKRGWGA